MDIILSAIAQRTGSTLVQRIFNSRKQTLIWGEHGGAISSFFQAYERTKKFSIASEYERHTYFSSGENPNKWTANMTPKESFVDDAIVVSLKAYLDTLYSFKREGHDTVGFKEVRYGKHEIELLRKCYPNAKIIFIVRHPIDSWRSVPDHWENSLDEHIKKHEAHGRFYADFMKSDKHAYLFRYEDIVNHDPNTIQTLASLANISVDQVKQVIGVKLNSTSKQKPRHQEVRILRECHDFCELFGYK